MRSRPRAPERDDRTDPIREFPNALVPGPPLPSRVVFVDRLGVKTEKHLERRAGRAHAPAGSCLLEPGSAQADEADRAWATPESGSDLVP